MERMLTQTPTVHMLELETVLSFKKHKVQARWHHSELVIFYIKISLLEASKGWCLRCLLLHYIYGSGPLGKSRLHHDFAGPLQGKCC